MSGLHTLSIRIPGPWRDAWLYKENLVLWARDGSAHYLPTKTILRAIKRQYGPDEAVLSEYLIFRNDWKASEQFHSLLDLTGVRRSFLGPLRDPSRNSMVLESLLPEEILGEVIPGIVLDVEMYANRVYLGTTHGLFETYFDPRYPRGIEIQRQHLDFRVQQVVAKYASVNASADENGLWYAPVEFDDENGIPDTQQSFDRIADLSLGASFASRHLLNYTTGRVPTFLRSETSRRRPHPRAEYDNWHIIEFHDEADISLLVARTLETSNRTSLEEVRRQESTFSTKELNVLGNSDYRLLVEWGDELSVVDLSAFEGRDIEARPDSRFREHAETNGHPAWVNVLSTYAIGGGFILETFDDVRMLTPQGCYVVFQGAAARIRTFVNSRRHKETFVVIDQAGVEMIGFAQF